MREWILLGLLASLAAAAEPRYRIDVEPVSQPADWSQFHRWTIRVRWPWGFAPRLREFRFECRSAALNRPPAFEPRVTEIGPGLFVAEGVRFDLPGEWEVEARVRDDDGWQRVTRRIRTGPADLLDHVLALKAVHRSRFGRFATALLEGREPEPGSRLTDAEQSGLRLYLGREGGCTRCHDQAPRRTEIPNGHATHLGDRDRSDVETFLRTLDPPVSIE